MFTKYRKTSDSTKILLMYLLLNGYDIKNVEWAEEIEESRMFGLTIKKIYGITRDYVDVSRIEREIEEIKNPIVCSPLSYEYYSDAQNIYSFSPALPDVPLWINDMDIISSVMIITEDRVVSSSYAYPIEDDRCKNKGFMFFYEYVLKEECVVGKWRLQYKNKVFSVYYISLNNDKEEEVLLYSAIEIDKTSTYKIVIYIISKASIVIDEWLPDNFSVQSYEMAVN